ncbi:MAG: SPOR domain-containing protein [Bacteroidota bacterium]
MTFALTTGPDAPSTLRTKIKVLQTCSRVFLAMSLLLILLVFPESSKAQVSATDYEEIPVYLLVEGIGGYEVTAIYKNNEIYLPCEEIFKCLKINCEISTSNDSIRGIFLTENNPYFINLAGHSVFVDGKLNMLGENELLYTETYGIALKLDQYGKLFGLVCKFNFNSLTIELKSSHELPVLKELRLEQMRKNISRLRGEISVDTTYLRRYHLLRGNMADWALYSTQTSNGATETRAMLGLGTEFLGGETNIELNYSSKTNFDQRQQQYRWRWANNSTKAVKQVTLGKISSRSIASIYSPLIGLVITNTPTTYRRSFGTFTMTDFTEPGWTVELYINNVIIDFTTADASGFFKFDIPLVYGSSNVLVKFYGPWGEERQKEQTINVPFNFLPKHEFEYTIASAMVQDTSHSLFTHGEANFGISRHFTVGGGVEYLSSIRSAPSIPFVNGSAQLFNNFLINGEYAYGVRSKALISYSLPSSLVVDIDYTKYAHEQKAITFNYLEERKIRISLPISFRSLKAYSRLSYTQNILKETTYSTAEATLSTFYKGMSANFTGNANWLGNYDTYIYGNLALGFRLFKTISFRPQAQYDFSNKNLVFTKAEIENNFSPRCNLSLIWENNLRSGFNSVELTFRYDLSFAQISLNTRVSDKYFSTGQSARGSFAFGSGNGRVIADRRSQVGRAGLTIIPFLDINNNNHRDDNEPITKGMNIRMNGGRILPSSGDSIIRILDLEPFASYMLEFSDTQFDNIAWQIPDKAISILMDPNQFKLLEVPIKVMAEINGTVYIKTGSRLKPQGRIVINIFTAEGKMVTKVQSESDGYFTFIGLGPGSYYAEIDSMQLSRLKAIPHPASYDFKIQPTINGDIIDNIEFQLVKENSDVQGILVPDPKLAEPESSEPKQTTTQLSTGSDKNKKSENSSEPNIEPEGSQTKGLKQEAKQNEKKIENNPIKTGLIHSAITPTKINKPTTNFNPEVAQKSGSNNAGLAEKAGKFKEPEKINSGNNELPSKTKESAKTISLAKEASALSPSLTDSSSKGVAGNYYIQAGALKTYAQAEQLSADLLTTTGRKWLIASENGYFKVRLGYYGSRKTANGILKLLGKPGINCYIDSVK